MYYFNSKVKKTRHLGIRRHCYPRDAIAMLSVIMSAVGGENALADTNVMANDNADMKSEFRFDMNRLDGISKSGSIDITSAKVLSDQIAQKWINKGDDVFIPIISSICNIFQSHYFGTGDIGKQESLANDYAQMALTHSPQMSMQNQILFTEYSSGALIYPIKRISNAEFDTHREANVALWVQCWTRLNGLIDPKFDPKEVISVGGVPASEDGGIRLPSDIDPLSIKDPKLREMYQAVIDERSRKAQVYNEQFTLHAEWTHFRQEFSQYLIAIYSRQPPSIEEAKAVVSSTFGNDKESKDIISAIASNIDTARREHKMVSLAKTTTAAGPEAQIAPPVAVIPDATMKH